MFCSHFVLLKSDSDVQKNPPQKRSIIHFKLINFHDDLFSKQNNLYKFESENKAILGFKKNHFQMFREKCKRQLDETLTKKQFKVYKFISISHESKSSWDIFTNFCPFGLLRKKNFWRIKTGSAITNGREPRSCLGRVFNFKIGSFTWLTPKMLSVQMDKFKVENSAQVLSC